MNKKINKSEPRSNVPGLRMSAGDVYAHTICIKWPADGQLTSSLKFIIELCRYITLKDIAFS